MTNLVNHSVTNLINGVSQQDPSVRLDNQVSEQVNCFSDITRGLTRRNGLELMNVSPIDVRDYIKINFNIDGVSHAIAINADSSSDTAKYIPLRQTDPAISVTLNDPQYFKGALSDDIEVLEDKDRVYVLNKKQKVGTATGRSIYFDIKTVNDRTAIPDSNWERGDYYITVHGVRDPNFPVIVPYQFDYLVDSTTTLQDIVDAINADTALTDETGPVIGEGSIDNFRLYFRQVPSGWVLPNCFLTENTDMEWDWTSEVDSGWRYSMDSYDFVTGFTKTYIYWGGVRIGAWSGQLSSATVGNSKYYRGALRTTTGGIYTRNYHYNIKRIDTIHNTDSYTPSITSSFLNQNSTQGATDGMIGITGVSQNQTYDVTITYYDVNAPLTPLTVTGTASVGTTASNIKLNWVAGTLSTSLNTNGAAVLSTSTYDNAIYILMNAGYEITSIDVTNNFDTSSISGVPRAVESNTAGLTSIDNLPPLFIQGFIVRVNPSQGEETSNYYMQYDAGFKGWKEKPLDESRFIDRNTMPYVINKQEFRENGTITLEPIFWEFSKAGDKESNVDPSFIDRTINDMFFYGSRLGMATDDSLVMSAIDNPLQFFRTTTSLVKGSDRKDIKLDSSKIGFNTIKHVVSYEGRLFVNTGFSQSVLLVNSSFDLTTARLSEVSSYTLGFTKPLPVGNSLYFSLSTRGTTRVFNYSPLGDNNYESIDMTKHCPQYIKGTIQKMEYDSGLTVVQTDADSKILYVQNTYSSGGQIVQNSWHKWTLPYDVEHFYFFNNTLYVIFSANNDLDVVHTLVATYDITPQEVRELSDEIYIGWIPYLDLYTRDYDLISLFPDFTAVNAGSGFHYDTKEDGAAATEQNQVLQQNPEGPLYDIVGPNFSYWRITGSTVTIFWEGTEITVGGGELLQSHVEGNYLYTREASQAEDGYYSISRVELVTTTEPSEDVLFGIPFTSTVNLSKIVPRTASGDGGYTVMNFAKLMLRRMRLLLGKSGIFEVTVNLENRRNVTKKYTGKPVGSFVIGRGTVSDINFRFPINTLVDYADISISTLDTTPFNLITAEWQGQFISKGRNI